VRIDSELSHVLIVAALGILVINYIWMKQALLAPS
jgi:hypothetical protein